MNTRKYFIIGLCLMFFSKVLFAQDVDLLLDTLQHTAFNFFWNEANPANGLIKDRSASGAPSSIASVGFGLTAICIGIDHGWIPREAGRDRVLTTLRTFWEGPQGRDSSGFIGYRGFFYHFLDMTTALRTWDSELSSIDTGLLLAGFLYAKQYFDGTDSAEVEIRALADSIYRRVDWNWMRNYNPGVLMGWMPRTQFTGFGQWIGYNEAMILYILALGSPTHQVPTDAWQAWTSGYSWQTHYGYSYVNFPPLFGHQYSHCWIDFRNIADWYMRWRGIDYFENSRRATLAQRAYCIANPGNFTGYGDSLWGITACDGPTGYAARGAPPAQNDDGTIAPTAAIGSIPFTPEYSIPLLRNLYNAYHDTLWMVYGFRDAFNLTANPDWWGPDVIGIDQGPIIIMIENYRTQSVWNRFMQNPDIQLGLQRAGFQPVTNVENDKIIPRETSLMRNWPNPFNPSTKIGFKIHVSSFTILKIYNLLGQEVTTLVNEELKPGNYEVTWDASDQPSGVYFYRLIAGGYSGTRNMVLVR